MIIYWMTLFFKYWVSDILYQPELTCQINDPVHETIITL